MAQAACALIFAFMSLRLASLLWGVSCAADYEEPRAPLANRLRSRSLKLLSFVCESGAGVALAAAALSSAVAVFKIMEVLK